MNNFKYILFATFLAFVSCQHEEAINDVRIDVTFIAQSEGRTKTVLANDYVLWDEGDQIKIMWEGGSAVSEARVGDDRTTAEFAASVPENQAYYAVTPHTVSSALTSDRITIDVPQNQTGTFAGANIAVAKADEQNHLMFRHAVGYVEFTTDKAGTVEFAGADNDILAGITTISGFEESGIPQYSYDKGTSKISVVVEEPGTYYMAVVPGAELNGFTIRMISEEGRESASYSQKVIIERGKLLPLGNITERLKKDGQYESINEKFDITDIFEEAKQSGICIPNAVSMDSDLSYLPESISTLELTVSSSVPLTI